MWFNWKSVKQRKYLEAQAKINEEMVCLHSYDPKLTEESGIYLLTRVDKPKADGTVRRCVYVGQAKNILQRLAQHLMGFQVVDISMRKHGLKYPSNPYGWCINVEYCPIEQLDERERFWINDFQTREDEWEIFNITSGGQGEGKTDINERKAAKTYMDGLKQGYENCKKEVQDFCKYLFFMANEDFVINDRKVIEFEQWLKK